MKNHNLIVIPLVFVAGVLTIVLLQRVGLVQINQPTNEARASVNAAQAPEVSNSQLSETSASIVTGTAAPSTEQLNNRINELQQQIRSATVKADLMRSDIDQLNTKIDVAAIANDQFGGSEFLPQGDSSQTQPASDVAQTAALRSQGFNSPDNDVQYTSLVSAGVDPSVADEIKQRSDQWTLQRLELVDQATREGWRRSEQFGERLSELREERPDIRSELGDEQYDRYLYAAGEANRVQISSIIDGSAAFTAGLQNGDVVVSYANQRIFTMRELQSATSAGSRGEPIQLGFLRDNQPFSVEIPRGPMGVTLTGQRVEPSAF